MLFKQVFVGKNTTVKNCVLLNDVYIGDNVHLENCIVESRGTINPNTCYCGEDKVMIDKRKKCKICNLKQTRGTKICRLQTSEFVR